MKIISSSLLVLLFLSAFGQREISGKIQDAESGDPVEFALIYNLTQDTHTHSDIQGRFILSAVNKSDSIMVSILGYEKQFLRAEANTDWNIFITPAPVELGQVTIMPELDALNSIKAVELKLNPVNSSQEILRTVPGLFIAQHAGGGKAEQIFLRGFDIDHGTDISITTDGMPVNMVSHAHGQGYADLHFLIPETIQSIDFGKGPYNADKGNFATAGYVGFRTMDRLKSSSVKLEAGQFNTFRGVGLIDLMPENGLTDAYIATEFLRSDGPFDSPQSFSRNNIMAKISTQVGGGYMSLSASTFQSEWDASGQVPVRAVESGQISRFGAIDDTEGGRTSRQNLIMNYSHRLNSASLLSTNFYVAKYDFELFSNFTFFLNDPVNGDQIRQRESRTMMGGQIDHTYETKALFGNLTIRNGGGFRNDIVTGNELSRTINRKEISDSIALGNINEFNGFLFSDYTWERGKWTLNAGVRLDQFQFQEVDLLQVQYDRASAAKYIVSPKFNAIYSANDQWQFYAKSGKGFHSNDTRVVVDNSASNTLPAAYGFDLGTIYRPFDRLLLDVAYWQLHLEQEFVYVGDEGVVEAGGRTRREGIDVGLNYQLTDHFFLYGHMNYADPRSVEDPEGENYIPLAPTLTSSGGLTYQNKGFSGSVTWRYLKDRAANEDNSVVADGYFLTDISLNYDRSNWGVLLSIENLFNTEWREAQFDTESQLQNEVAPVSEIHFTPGTPFFAKAGVVFKF